MNLPLDKMGDSRAILPVSAVIATADRADALAKCIETVIAQDARLKEIVVVDASEGGETKAVCEGYTDLLKSGNSDVGGKCLHAEVVYLRAQARGAATQRNQGVAAVSQPFILFMDDDVELQQGCLAKLWEAMMSDGTVGGVSSMIINQKYANPGRVTRFLYRLVSGERHDNFAGRCLGPAFTVLPEDLHSLSPGSSSDPCLSRSLHRLLLR
ncbi:MAG: glycosyltransferase family 2 protein [Deltaproteobacteria bacterium]|nr:glycosyltransferase family 2 protein [Deltaproteobacteria bacterium]